MDHFAGLDVSVKETSVCIVDDTGRIVREVKVASEPEALLTALKNPSYHFKRIGLEAGPLSQWLFSALAEAELPVVCVETRHMQAVLKAQINKTDRNDARGIAQMMRVGLYRPVHVKTLRSQKLRMMLTHRKLLQSKAIAIENDLRGTLRPGHRDEPGDRPRNDELADPADRRPRPGQQVGQAQRRQYHPGLDHLGLEGQPDPDASQDQPTRGPAQSAEAPGRACDCRGHRVGRQHQQQDHQRVGDVPTVQGDGGRADRQDQRGDQACCRAARRLTAR